MMCASLPAGARSSRSVLRPGCGARPHLTSVGDVHWLDAQGYWVGRLVFERSLAALYAVAFVVAANQFRALLGSRGLLPIPRFVARVPFRRSPSLFHLHYSDRFFAAVAWFGAALSLAVVVGLAERLPLAAYVAAWLVLWLLYLSIVNVGQTWYGFGWETLLLEAGFLAAFLGSGSAAPTIPVLLLVRWLLFRLEFGAGLIKIRGDRCWRDLTCLYYHHETQPMPGPFSWYFHHLPRPLHRVEVAANHVAQLAVPFLLFTPQPVAGAAAGLMVVTQLWLVVSGNFSWLNWLTIVLGLSVLPDSFWTWLLPLPAHTPGARSPLWYDGLILAVTALLVVLSWWPARNLLSGRQLMNASFNRLHLANTYGAFGSITRVRHEVVVEGTTADHLDADTTWHEYGFRGKPGDCRRLPRQFAPYHLRLDWMMWFAALSPGYAESWFRPFVVRLLHNDASTVKLLRHNPFEQEPPTYVRARLYRYRFTSPAERRESGAWWKRSLVGEYLPPVSLREPSGT